MVHAQATCQRADSHQTRATKTGTPMLRYAESPGSSEVILAVSLDRHIRGRVSDAREAEAVVHLVVVQEGLVRLVDRAFDHLARAARARAGAARVRQLEALLLGLVQDVDVIWALEGLLAVRSLQGHRVMHCNVPTRRDRVHNCRRGTASEGAAATAPGDEAALLVQALHGR